MTSRPRPPLRVLVVEDTVADAELLYYQLERGFDVTYERVTNEAALRAALARGSWDLVTADYELPGFSGLRALEIVQASGQDLPFMIVSGQIDEATAIAAMRAGAHDYFFKGDLDRLIPAIERELREAAERRARRAAEAALRERIDLLQTLLDILPVGICVAYDPACTQMTINPAGARMLGISQDTNPSKSGPTAAKLPFRVLQHGVEVPPEQLPIQMAAAHDVSVRDVDYDVVHADGRIVNLLEYAAPLHDEQGRVRGAVGVFVDITERKQAEQAQHLLAEAGRLLSTSLDYEATLQAVVRLPLPEMADFSLVYLTDPDGQVRSVAHAHVDQAKEAVLAEASQLYAPNPDNPHSLLGQVLKTGQPLLMAQITTEVFDRFPLPPRVRQLARELDTRSFVAVPLLARGETLGVILFGYAASGRYYRETDLPLLEELARRAATAVDNARLFATTQALNAELEQRVAERTAELQAANAALERQVNERYQAELRFRGLLEAAPDAIVIVDERGQIVMVNSQTEALFGYPRAELIGQPVEKLMPAEFAGLHEQHRQGYLGSPRTRQMGLGLELFGRRRDGSSFPIEISLSPLQTEQGILVTSAIRDTTGRKLAEVELRESREQLRRLTARLEAAREEERARIAYEVHDELGQQLTGLKMDVAWLQKRLGPDRPDMLAKTQAMVELIDSAIQNVRQITADLRPGLLDDFGLPAVLEWQLQEFQARTGVQAQLVSLGEHLPLTAEQALSLYRIAQEALNNVARHADASAVEVRLEPAGNGVRLSVRDNGRGLERTRLLGTKSLGLLGMRERMRQLGGSLEVHSELGQGTTVVAELPLSSGGAAPGAK